MSKLIIAALFLLSFGFSSSAQELPVPAEMQRAYNNGTRTKAGKPGPKYWQNTTDYAVNMEFDPATRKISAVAELTYKNNSPDMLKEVWFKLLSNLYKKGVPNKAAIREADKGEGVQITQFDINGVKSLASMLINGTTMTVPVAGIAPGTTTKFVISYSYFLNENSHLRTGQVDPGAHFIAYSIPRIAVYDDIDGWDKYAYNGSEEFYNDFGDFKVNVTVPKGFVVWATGDLTNMRDVFTTPIVDKFRRAEKSGAVIDVITAEDLTTGQVTLPNQTNTFKFDARHVPDFAIAVADHYLWKSKSLIVDSTSGRRTRVDAVFNPAHKDYFEVIDFAWKTVDAMSFKFPKWPFPYSHITVFDGKDQMEYPMMVNDNPTESREDAITLTDHEVFHTMFPFYMGTNETKHAWMDEGWATIGEWLISPMIDATIVDTYGIAQTARSSGTKDDVPIVTFTPDLKGSGSFTNAYPKPGLGYLYVRDMLGEQLFTKALHNYIATWNGKHPQPLDFFNSMNAGGGKDLNWFWKRWFYEEGVLDMGIKMVVKTSNGYDVQVVNKSNKPMPVHLLVKYQDGSEEKVHRTIEVWKDTPNVTTINVKTGKVIASMKLGDSHVPDKDMSDNAWKAN